jgi:hypothetical protein
MYAEEQKACQGNLQAFWFLKEGSPIWTGIRQPSGMK